MATRFFCDVCNGEMTAEEYRETRPNETKIAAALHESMCQKCVKAFAALNIRLMVRNAILEARKDIPEGRIEG